MSPQGLPTAIMRHRFGLGAAVSLLLMTELDRRSKQQEEDDHHQSLVSNTTRQSSYLSMVPSNEFPSSPRWWWSSAPCHCEWLQHLPMSRLARHRTIRRMEDTSSRASLHSRYKIDWKKPLGEGAFGAVYAATDRRTGEQVALKKINKDFTDNKAFQREMNALLYLRQAGGHPNICGLHENFDEGQHYYLTLDLVNGGEMFDHLVRLGAYSEADAARLVREVASALAFLHGIGVVHGDLKPENLMLSTENASDAVIKVVDFGCAHVEAEDSIFNESSELGKKLLQQKSQVVGTTPAYCPPEVLDKSIDWYDPSFDAWSMGIILYIMLTGLHPFDLDGRSSDEEIGRRIITRQAPPLVDSPITAHLSDSAIDLIQKLMAWNPKDRITAIEMLQHPWVRGETANQDKMAGSDKKLKMFRVFKSRLEAKVFADIVSWSDKAAAGADDVSKRTSLIERSFRSFDSEGKGSISIKDLETLTKKKGAKGQGSRGTDTLDDGSTGPLSLSGFEDLLAENMKNKYYPKGHFIYREGDIGNHMYFINSGTVEVSTKEGTRVQRKQGDFFGEGALLHPEKIRSATIRCVTPVHALEISREYFEKYLASSEQGLYLNLKEKDKNRKRNRAKTILRLQKSLKPLVLKKGENLYKVHEQGNELFILEKGELDVLVEDHAVFTVKQPGNLCGEHSLVTGRPRNTSAVCASDECKVLTMKARDFHALMDHSPTLKESMRDICLRREFQKAVVFKTKKAFPAVINEKALREVFEAADEDDSGKISLDNLRTMMKLYDPTISEEDLMHVMEALDLSEDGAVSFEEFKQLFGMDEAQESARV